MFRIAKICFVIFGSVLPAFALSFQTDVLPVLTKAGCNSGACHGAATGQGGFSLSLLGYDPQEDYERLTHEKGGRRIDTAAPSASLILRKTSGALEHEGGRRLPPNSPGYQLLLQWIRDGASPGNRELVITGIAVDPSDWMATDQNRSTRLKVRATLSDDTSRDVTDLALYTSNDDGVAQVSKTGEVFVESPGSTCIMVRFGGQVAAARVAKAYPGQVPTAWPPKQNEMIDKHIVPGLKRLHLPASELSSDYEFCRRVSLDLAGRLPEPNEVLSFGNASSQDRVALIDRLLRSEEFTDLWTLHLADLLLVGGKGARADSAKLYQSYLREKIAKGIGLDVLVRELLTSSGDITREPAANFYTLAADPRDMAEHVGSMFMGIQIGCARCHAHPTDRWTQTDYYQFAACFAGVSREDKQIRLKQKWTLPHPKSGAEIGALPPGLRKRSSSTQDPRRDLAEWLTKPKTGPFAPAMVNRVWKILMGRGLIDPVDDVRVSNPATHPALLQELSEAFIANGYDLRWLVRTIVTSRAYQLTSKSSEGNRLDAQFYSHALVKPLPAQVLLDAISQATGVREEFPGEAGDVRAVQLVGVGTPSEALDVLGRCSRNRTCDRTVGGQGGLAQALHLINGATINRKISGGHLAALLQQSASNEQIISELYLRTLSRPPTAQEKDVWNQAFEKSSNPKELAEDFFWTLLNSREFIFNH